MVPDGDDEEAPDPSGRLGAQGRIHMTPDGHRRLRDEFAARKAERHRTVEIVAWAAGNGDRSENADYKEGKRRLRELDRRLRFLAGRLAAAEIVDPSNPARRDRVLFGATVTYWSERSDAEASVTIVGIDESDVAAGRISLASPIAAALLGRACGDEVPVRTPRGTDTLEILAISYPAAGGFSD